MNQSEVSSKRLMSVVIAPQGAAVALGNSQQFSATALFSDGTKADVTSSAAWSSGQTKVAIVTGAGLASSKSAGSVSISAVYQSASGSSTLTVTAAALISIAVTPQSLSLTPKHSTQLSASGNFSDGSKHDLTSTVSWSSSPAGIVAISSAGLATAQALGTATINASSNSVSAAGTVTVVAPTLKSISISSGGETIPLGESHSLSAIGQYNDGSTQDLTGSVQWTSSDPTILSISSSGRATANAQGSVTVTAESGAINGTVSEVVGPPVAVSFTVIPADSVLAVGGHEQLKAVATLSDGTIQATTATGSWSSSNRSVASITNEGWVVARHTGDTILSISSDSVEGSTTLTVKPVLSVSYFSHANTSGFADATVRLSNPGPTGGSLCADIYVFDQDQQLSECCSCLMSPNGLRTLSVNSDLTRNPLTGVKSTTGVIKIVSSDLPVNASCDPTAVSPSGELSAWSTNIQRSSASAFAVTESSFQTTPLGDDELHALQSQCSFARSLGSGNGVCTCGADPGSGSQNSGQ